MPYQAETFLYSCCKNAAAANAVVVWPEGNELLPEPSGRWTFVIDFKDNTAAEEITVVIA